MARQKTNDDVREGFIAATGGASREKAIEEVVFLILTTLEGAGDFPYCAIIPQPHPSDEDFHRKNGEDWYPCPDVEQEAADEALLRGEDHHQL